MMNGEDEGCSKVAQCGFCLQKGTELQDLKVLQCSHVHCLNCLMENRNIMGIIHCPACQENYDLDPAKLPSAAMRDGAGVKVTVVGCDVCLENGRGNGEAVAFCKSCSKKLCPSHQNNHDGMFSFHEKLTIEEYRYQAKKLEVRHCSEHKLGYVLACRTCFSVLCLRCMAKNSVCACSTGAAHPPVPLDTLVMSVTTELRELKSELMDKEDKLQDLFKKLSELLAEFDGKTTEMLERIHKQREEQIKAIEKQYAELEWELIKLRRESKAAMEEFMEQEVGTTIHRLSKQCLQIDARIKHEHQVDLVTGYVETKKQIESLLSQKMPILELEQLGTIESVDESRTTEVKIVSENPTVVDYENGLTMAPTAPQTLSLLKTIRLSSNSLCVCHYKGVTYVGLGIGGINRIDCDGKIMQLLKKQRVSSIAVYEDKIYILLKGTLCTVSVYSLTGRLIYSWSHTDSGRSCNKLCIESDMVVIPDRTNRQLTVYSLSGAILRQIPIDLFNEEAFLALCSAGSQCVLVSVYDMPTLLKVNIATGDIIWINQPEISETPPIGITTYGQKWILMASKSCDEMNIIDNMTGELHSSLTVKNLGEDMVTNLHVSRNTLVVGSYNKREVVHYKLE